MNQNCEIAIIVYSCEKNRQMWKPLIYFFRKYWPDCDIPMVLLTDSDKDRWGENLGYDRTIIKDTTWAQMMKYALQELNVPYFITWMDDYWLTDYVDTRIFNVLFEKTKKYDALNMRLSKTLNSDENRFKYDIELGVIDPGTAYSFSTQAGIWNSRYFIETLKDEWSPWDYERVGSMNNDYLTRDILVSETYSLPYFESVRKGKIFPKGIELLKQMGLSPADVGKEAMSKKEWYINNIKGIILKACPNAVVKIQNYLMQKEY